MVLQKKPIYEWFQPIVWPYLSTIYKLATNITLLFVLSFNLNNQKILCLLSIYQDSNRFEPPCPAGIRGSQAIYKCSVFIANNRLFFLQVSINNPSNYNAGLSEPGVRWGTGRVKSPPPNTNIGRSVNPISIRGKIMPNTLLLAPPTTPDFKTFLRPCNRRINHASDHIVLHKWPGCGALSLW